MLISVAIPTYNNARFLKETLNYIITDNRISEIIMVDDCSNDNNKELIQEIIKPISKIKFYQNSKNLGVYPNKIKAVELCKNEWVILLDADNIIEKNYIDVIFKENLQKDIIYAPEWARTFNNHKMDGYSHMLIYKEYGNQIIDKKIALGNRNKAKFKCLMNTGNYLLHKNTFLNTMKNKPEYERSMSCIDVFYANHKWLKDNKKIKVVKDLQYFHRLHSSSTYMISTKSRETHWNNFFFKNLE